MQPVLGFLVLQRQRDSHQGAGVEQGTAVAKNCWCYVPCCHLLQGLMQVCCLWEGVISDHTTPFLF
jgi:hypothetical protein